MYYNISRTLEFLPYLAYTLLVIVWIFMEVKNFREQLSEEPTTEPGRGSFILPPGNGYEYYVNSNNICYIYQKAKNRFQIYVIRGQSPAVRMKRDKYGAYFNIRCRDARSAEKIVDAAYGLI